MVLYYLLSTECTNIETLSVNIAAWEREKSVTSVDAEARRAVEISLHHNHLPQLAAHDIVEYDTRNGDVVRATGFDDVRSTIEQVRETAEQADGTDRSVDSSFEERVTSNF